ncbi:MAG: CBS domain-containing protein [Candidatus Omnitrophota bacterium]|jgi:CBS domain-containing protein
MIAIDEIITSDVITVKTGTPIYEALNILTRNRVSGAPVVDDDNHVVGMLSERDLLRILVERDIRVNDIVDDFMSKKVVTFNDDEDAIDICKVFINSAFRRVPILRDNQLVGIVSRKDCIYAMAEAQRKLQEFPNIDETVLRYVLTEKERQRLRNRLARKNVH